MLSSIFKNIPVKRSSNRVLDFLRLFWVLIYILTILQDFIFAKLQHTGFYLSESMLYNTYWLLFIPVIYILNTFYKKIKPKSLTYKILYLSASGIVFSVIHLLLFTSLFILLSNILYSVPHHFLSILKSALSNQLYLTIIAYISIPIIFKHFSSKEPVDKSIKSQYSNRISIKQNTTTIAVDTHDIQSIEMDKPYAVVYANDQKFLHHESLKSIQSKLDPTVFFRVHRSSIVNLNYIIELKSRKNGDYDAVLANGNSIRLSRHYRANWGKLYSIWTNK